MDGNQRKNWWEEAISLSPHRAPDRNPIAPTLVISIECRHIVDQDFDECLLPRGESRCGGSSTV